MVWVYTASSDLELGILLFVPLASTTAVVYKWPYHKKFRYHLGLYAVTSNVN